MSMLGPVRHTSRRLRRPDPSASKKAAPPPAPAARPARGDLPMRTFALAALVIVGSVGGAGLVGHRARGPRVAEAPLPPPPPLVERSQDPGEAPPRASVAPAISVELEQVPVRVDLDGGVVVLGHDPAELGLEGLPAPERLSIARLDEHVRSIGGDEHLRHWLELVDGRRIEVSRETAEEVRRLMPFRAGYDRGAAEAAREAAD